MPRYSFKITKGKYQLSLITSDKEVVEEQFAAWVRCASTFVSRKKNNSTNELIKTQLHVENEINKNKIKTTEKITKFTNTNKEIENTSKILHDKNKTVDLDIFYTPTNSNDDNVKKVINTGNFENVLDNSMNKSQTELSFKPSPSLKKDNAFINYISSRNIDKKMDYLLMTAYYFTQYEQKPRFTLKQINAKLMQNLAVILDHAVLQEAMQRDYIECLPDLTGLVGVSEYRLTAYGEKVLLDD